MRATARQAQRGKATTGSRPSSCNWQPCGASRKRNICVGGRWGDFDGKAKPLVTFTDNLLDQDPLFVDAQRQDFRLKPESPALKLGFKPLPTAEIGLYQDAQRASWPVKSEVRPMATPPAAPATSSSLRVKPFARCRWKAA